MKCIFEKRGDRLACVQCGHSLPIAGPHGPRRPESVHRACRAGNERGPVVAGQPKLTIGIPVYDDYQGLYFTLQSLRLHHADALDDCEILVVDNNPESEQGKLTKKIALACSRGRYLPFTESQGTANAKEKVMRSAAGQAVLCIDSHVLLPPGVIRRLIDFYDQHPQCNDLLHGPLLHDDLNPATVETHMEPHWRGRSWGTWARDPRGVSGEGEPFEIWGHGMGLFSCRKTAWVGFNQHLRGFGCEEGYIHEKFRRAGRRVLCVPWLRWVHRFNRPGGIPYPALRADKIRNYLIQFVELGINPLPMIEHFRQPFEDDPPTPPEEILRIADEVHALNIELRCEHRGEPLPERLTGDLCGQDSQGNGKRVTKYDVFDCGKFGERVTLESVCTKIQRNCGTCVRLGEHRSEPAPV